MWCDCMVVLDTDVIIDYLLGRDRVVAAVNAYAPSELSTTFINQYELLKYEGRRYLDEAMDNLAIHQSSGSAARAAADAYRMLKAGGKTMSDNDLMVFGICVASNETLLTQDGGFRELHDSRVVVLE